MRLLIAALVSFVVSAIAGKILIPVLRRMKAGQSIKEDGPTWHMSKQGTPTMGGLMFILGILCTLLLIGWTDIARGDFRALFVFCFALVFGVIGYLDDYEKVKKKENTGLTAGPKFLLQLAAAIVFTVLLRHYGYLAPHLYLPFVNLVVELPWVVYMVFAAFVMVGTVNAVNITDGVDGLSSSVTLPVAAFFAAVSAGGAASTRTSACSPGRCSAAWRPSCSTTIIPPRCLWGTPAPCSWGARCAAWPLPLTCR